jgi:hypothetical protein
MKFKLTSFKKYFKLRDERLAEWHKWFAWRPVRLDDDHMVWLEFVFRQVDPNRASGDLFYYGDYREYNEFEAIKIKEEEERLNEYTN